MRLRYSALLLLSALTADDERLRTVILMSTEDQGTPLKNYFFVNIYFIGSPIVQPPWVITRLTEALSEQQDPNDPDARLSDNKYNFLAVFSGEF